MELKAEDVKNIRSLAVCKELLRQAIELNDQLNEELSHQKYKRCLNMSNWCSIRSNLFFVVGRNEGVKFAKEKFRRSDLYSKWCLRWFKIAEQFKEAK